MKFKFSAIIGRGKGNESAFTEEVELPGDPSDTEVESAYNKWEAGLTRVSQIAPVKEK